MEDLKEVVMVDGARALGSPAPKEVVGGFSFLALPLTNHIGVDYLKHERNIQTYITSHLRSVGCHPTHGKVRWWLESQV